MLLNYLISIIFLILGSAYIYTSIRYKMDVNEENLIVSLFAVTSTAYCFMFSYLGFVNPYLETMVTYTYIFLSFAGTKTSLRLIFRKYKSKGESFNWLNNRYVLATSFAILSQLISTGLGILIQNNILIMMGNLIVPIYLLYVVLINGYILIKEKKFFVETVFTNFNLIAFSISIYEIVDFVVFIFNYPSFNIYGTVYRDPTHSFDIFWALANTVIFIFLPRMKFVFKEKDKLIK